MTEERFTLIEGRLDDHEKRLDRHAYVIYGDNQEASTGLLSRLSRVEKIVEQLAHIQQDMATRWDTLERLAKIFGWIIGVTGVGVWLSFLASLVQHTPHVP